MTTTTEVIIGHLHELIAALDGRRTQPSRAGEAEVVRAAAALRLRALARLAELEGEPTCR